MRALLYLFVVYLLPPLIAAGCMAIGAGSRSRPLVDRGFMLAVSVLMAATALIAIALRKPQKDTASVAVGVAVAAVALGGLPATSYYAAGRAVGRKRLLPVIWLVTLVPLEI
jgi:hypothetical protein